MSFPRIYSSFEDFARQELHRDRSMGFSVDELMQDRFAEEDYGDVVPRRKRGRPRKYDY